MVLERKRPSSLTDSKLAPRGEATSDDRAVPVLHHKLARCKLDSSPYPRAPSL